MGDKESRQNARAVAEAGRNVLGRRQRTYADIPRYELSITATAAEYRQIIGRIKIRYVEVSSYLVEGTPVTPPQVKENSHHIVALIDPEAGPEDHSIVSVELLIREYDNYYIAFRPLTRAHIEDDPSGWYCFLDVSIPEFLKKDLKKKENFHFLSFDSSYGDIGSVTVGYGSLMGIFRSYSKYTHQNAKLANRERHKVLMATMIFFGEGQRFPQILNELAGNIDNNIIEVLSPRLVNMVNVWSDICADIFEHLLGATGVLQDLEGSFDFVLHAGERYLLSLLVGPEAKVALLLYHKTLTRDLIKIRQSKQRR